MIYDGERLKELRCSKWAEKGGHNQATQPLQFVFLRMGQFLSTTKAYDTLYSTVWLAGLWRLQDGQRERRR